MLSIRNQKNVRGSWYSSCSCLAVLLPWLLLAEGVVGITARAEAAEKWAPYIDFEGRWGSERSVGETNLVLPMYQTDRSLYFANLRGRFAGDGDNEGSLGGGVRLMMENGWNLGTYGFWDRRRTEQGNTFNQATVGFEAIGRDFEWRANVYRPFGRRTKVIGESNTAEFAGGGLMVATTYLQERALPGFDVEAGWRLPVFEPEDERQFRVFLAGYRFEDEGVKIQGARVRGEFSLKPFREWDGTRLTFSAGYQNDNARHGQGFAGMRLRIPLGSSNSAATSLDEQERRMLMPVVRDVDVVTQMDTRTEKELATGTADGRSLAAISSSDISGTLLSSAISGAGANSTVAVAGEFVDVQQIQLLPGQTVMGAGTLGVRLSSGRTTNVVLPGATITGALFGNRALVEMADNSTLQGMTVRHVHNVGFSNPIAVLAGEVSGARILNNTIYTESSSGTAFGIRLDRSSNVIVGGNSIFAKHNDVTAYAVALQFVDSSGRAYENTVKAYGGSQNYAVHLVDAYGTLPEILPGSTGNVNLGGICEVSSPVVGASLSFVDGTTCP